MSLLVGLPESSGGQVRSFPQPASSTLTHNLGNETQAVGSETYHLIDMIIIIISNIAMSHDYLTI
jgi:hypothetical protein